MPGKKPASKPETLHRDAGTGRFVNEDYTEKHPRTTETEHRDRPSKPKKPSK